MTVKEYLRQAYRLDNRIHSDLAEMDNLREMAGSVGSPGFDERPNNPNRPTEAPFVKCLEKMWDLEAKINKETGKLVSLKTQIREVIAGVTDIDEQMVLRYRYIHNMSWEQIGNELYVDERTVRRWHGQALLHVKMPENPIVI